MNLFFISDENMTECLSDLKNFLLSCEKNQLFNDILSVVNCEKIIKYIFRLEKFCYHPDVSLTFSSRFFTSLIFNFECS